MNHCYLDTGALPSMAGRAAGRASGKASRRHTAEAEGKYPSMPPLPVPTQADTRSPSGHQGVSGNG